MGLRSPSEAIQLPILEELKALKWHTLECELVTPMYGGGVDAATVDLKMPIRVSAIKGQLRFWWRLLAKNKKDEWHDICYPITKEFRKVMSDSILNAFDSLQEDEDDDDESEDD